MADFVKAGGGIASADHREDGGGEKDDVKGFAAVVPTFRKCGESWGSRVRF
ncbi:MAG: hypothetical protein ACLQLC_08475 [Candidatus Sulfotelmatobacter sp.]